MSESLGLLESKNCKVPSLPVNSKNQISIINDKLEVKEIHGDVFKIIDEQGILPPLESNSKSKTITQSRSRSKPVTKLCCNETTLGNWLKRK